MQKIKDLKAISDILRDLPPLTPLPPSLQITTSAEMGPRLFWHPISKLHLHRPMHEETKQQIPSTLDVYFALQDPKSAL